MIMKSLFGDRGSRKQTMYCSYCEDHCDATHKEEYDQGYVINSWWVCDNCCYPIGTTRKQLRKELVIGWIVIAVLFAGAYYLINTMPV